MITMTELQARSEGGGMITMSHGERWRTPVSSDPPPSKTHHKSPGHTPRPRSPIYEHKLVGAAGPTDPPGPTEQKSGIYRPQNAQKGCFYVDGQLRSVTISADFYWSSYRDGWDG